jgi:hypothetical protein
MQDQPQVLSAIDETNLALEKVLGFTVGYYGSVLQVTGDAQYAKSLTTNYLSNALGNMTDIQPEWGSSFSLRSLDLSANWFTNNSYSAGQVVVTYDLAGLGISGINYSASCRLDVQVSNVPSSNKACLSVFKDGDEPLVNLGEQNFQFYRYQYSNLTWNYATPSGELVAFANGTYLIDIPSGIDSSSYVVQVTDTRGIMVAAASFSRITSTLMWNTTTPQGADYVDSSTVNKGTQSNFTAQQFGPDNINDTLTEGASGPVMPNYYPTSYVLGGSTTNVSGSLSYLQFDDSVRMIFRSYASGTSAQTLYAHQDITSILGTPYYTLKAASADNSGLTLNATMSSSRVLLGKSVYSLQNVSYIPASTWTASYRAWQDATAVTFDNASSVEAATSATSVSWSHTTGTASNRLLVVAVSVHVATGTPANVTSVTYGGVPLTQVTTALYSAAVPQVRTYIFRLVNPASGTKTITVNFTASTLYVCGATTYANVDQTTSIQNSATATGSSTSPSVSVNVTGTGRAVFGHLAGHRTAETTTQVTYVGAGAGSASSSLGYWPYTPTYPTPAYPIGLQANDLILLQVTVRDTTNTPTTPTGFTLLYGPDSTGTGRQWIYYRFATGSESGTITITIGGSSSKMARMYSFRNVALSSFTEGGGFGSGYSSTINAQSVTTTDTNRLAVSFVFVNDNNAVDSFTGETGGDWTEAVAEFTTSEGSDGCIQLQNATMASAGTISGGNYLMSASDPWGVRAFALKPKTTSQPWVITEGSGQNNRWAKETYLYKGRGSDRLNVAAGTVTMSWSTDYAPNWVCSAVVINPIVSAGHCDIDVLIRKSDNTTRSVIATNVANSSDLTSTATTLSGTYSWGNYTVVNQTDYLEVDYYVDVTILGSLNASLRIDDSSLALSNQTRIDGIMFPSEYTSEVEFIGTSNTQSWSQLSWTTDSTCTVAGVNVTVQLWNYQAGRYALSGENGYNSTPIGTSDVTMTQTITANAADFRNSSTGEWKLKFKAVNSTSTQFDLGIDLARYSPVPNYMLDIEEQWTNVDYAYPRQDLLIRTGNLSLNENLMVDVRAGSSWITVFDSLQPNTWNNVSVTPYISSQNFTIRFRDANNSSDPTQDSWNIDAVLLSPQPDIDVLLSQLDHTIVVELLQNGTMRWLGQNLQLATQEKPIPPVPVKAIHVNQTINGVNQEVPFQIEDWASEYRIPLGLTNNATVFSNRQMIVFLVNVNVSKITIWWNGSDQATQTPLAYTNRYFQDDPDHGILRNENLKLIFSSLYLYVDDFNSTSTSWTESGTSPYLNDDSNNYIYHNVTNEKEGWFTFQDLNTTYSQLFASPNQNIGASVSLGFECRRDRRDSSDSYDDYFEFRISDGTTTYGPYRIDPANGGSYGWGSYDVSSILNTPSKLNNAKIEVTCRQNANASNVYIRRARLSLDFWLTSLYSNSTTKADFMRINMEKSVYGAGIAYVIHHGIVRDIAQQEAEWSTGAENCPNVYANIVLTLPAKATYYTYQLRLMFIDSTQPRNITDLCPIKLATSIDQLQTENGTVNGIPIVANGTGNFSSSVWAHHWSQFISGSQGAGIMFTNASNQQLYVFDSMAGSPTGVLKANNSTKAIELLPVALSPVSGFTSALDVIWHGAVVTFDSSATPIYTTQDTAPTGLWLLVEYQPKITVTSES